MRSPLRTAVRSLSNQTPVPMTSARQPRMFGFGGRGSENTRDLELYNQVGTLFSVVNLLAESTSQASWHLYRDSDARGRIAGPDPRREVTTGHVALDMWTKPNDFMDQQLFVESFQQHIELTGKGFWVVERANGGTGIPLGMWPIRPDRMTPVPSVKDFLAGWVYTAPDGQQVPLAVGEVIWLRMPNPIDPYDGSGPTGAMTTDLQSSRLVSEWNRNFFKNSAQPGGIIQVEKRLSDPEFEEMTERWAEQHRGVNRAHNVAILEHGATWMTNQYTMKDMQFIELRKDARDIVYETFGVSKSMLGVTQDVNRANAMANEYVFSKYKSVPRLVRIRGALNEQLLPMFGSMAHGVHFDYDNPVPADWEADAATLKAGSHAALELIEAGWDPADVTAAVGLPPMNYIGPPARLALPRAVDATGDTETADDTTGSTNG